MTDIKLAAFIEVYGILAVVGTIVWMLVEELRQRSPWTELIPLLLFLEPRLRLERAPAVPLLRTHGRVLTGYSRRARVARHGRRVRGARPRNAAVTQSGTSVDTSHGVLL